MMLCIRAEDATIAWQRTEKGATTGAPMKDHSGVRWDVKQLTKAAMRAGKQRSCDQFTHGASLCSRMSFTHDSAAIAAGKPTVGIASSTT